MTIGDVVARAIVKRELAFFAGHELPMLILARGAAVDVLKPNKREQAEIAFELSRNKKQFVVICWDGMRRLVPATSIERR